MSERVSGGCLSSCLYVSVFIVLARACVFITCVRVLSMIGTTYGVVGLNDDLQMNDGSTVF